MLLKTLRMRFSKLHLLTQFYIHNVLYSQTRETKVTKYPFELGNIKCYIWSFVPEKLKTAVVNGCQMKTQIYFQLQNLPFSTSTMHLTAVGCHWDHHLETTHCKCLLTLVLSEASAGSTLPYHHAGRRTSKAAPGFWHKRAQCHTRSGLRYLWHSSCYRLTQDWAHEGSHTSA